MVLEPPALWPTAGKVGGSPKTSQWEQGGIDDDTAPMSEAEKTQGAAIPSVPGIQRDKFRDRHRLSNGPSRKGRGQRALSPKEAQTPGIRTSRRVRRRGEDCARDRKPHLPGGWSDPINNIEWKARPPENKKADLLQVRKSSSVEGAAGG